MSIDARTKWDRASGTFDLFNFAERRRFGPAKTRLFSKIRGSVLMAGVGTGNDFKYLPPRLDVIGIDISPKMLERAAVKARAYDGAITLREMDVASLDLPDSAFDTAVAVCTFCSVPKPIAGLRELRRVLKPGGQLLMFEHVRSAIGPIGIMLDLLTPLSRRVGPDLNRDTVGNVQKAGFRLRRVENVYLDIVKAIEAVKDDRGPM